MSPVWNTTQACSSPAITWAAPAETVQSLSQPSLSTVLASSHSSPSSRSPLPHSITTHMSSRHTRPSSHAPSAQVQFSSPGVQLGPVLELSTTPLLVPSSPVLDVPSPLPGVVVSAEVSGGGAVVELLLPLSELPVPSMPVGS